MDGVRLGKWCFRTVTTPTPAVAPALITQSPTRPLTPIAPSAPSSRAHRPPAGKTPPAALSTETRRRRHCFRHETIRHRRRCGRPQRRRSRGRPRGARGGRRGRGRGTARALAGRRRACCRPALEGKRLFACLVGLFIGPSRQLFDHAEAHLSPDCRPSPGRRSSAAAGCRRRRRYCCFRSKMMRAPGRRCCRGCRRCCSRPRRCRSGHEKGWWQAGCRRCWSCCHPRQQNRKPPAFSRYRELSSSGRLLFSKDFEVLMITS
jgi:hypothetical protein